MPPMLDRFVSEPGRNGHFTQFWGQDSTQNNDLAARELDRHPALSKDRQVPKASQTDHTPASTLAHKVVSAREQKQDIAHIGAWAKGKPT